MPVDFPHHVSNFQWNGFVNCRERNFQSEEKEEFSYMKGTKIFKIARRICLGEAEAWVGVVVWQTHQKLTQLMIQWICCKLHRTGYDHFCWHCVENLGNECICLIKDKLWLICTLTQSSRSLTSLAHSLTSSLTRSLAHPLTHSLTHSLIHTLTHTLTHSLTHTKYGIVFMWH